MSWACRHSQLHPPSPWASSCTSALCDPWLFLHKQHQAMSYTFYRTHAQIVQHSSANAYGPRSRCHKDPLTNTSADAIAEMIMHMHMRITAERRLTHQSYANCKRQQHRLHLSCNHASLSMLDGWMINCTDYHDWVDNTDWSGKTRWVHKTKTRLMG